MKGDSNEILSRSRYWGFQRQAYAYAHGRGQNGIGRGSPFLQWDDGEERTQNLGCGYTFEEIKIGMKKCASLGKIPESMGIDTWAVDFVLLDKNGGRIGDAVAYRDARTTGMDEGMPDCRR